MKVLTGHNAANNFRASNTLSLPQKSLLSFPVSLFWIPRSADNQSSCSSGMGRIKRSAVRSRSLESGHCWATSFTLRSWRWPEQTSREVNTAWVGICPRYHVPQGRRTLRCPPGFKQNRGSPCSRGRQITFGPLCRSTAYLSGVMLIRLYKNTAKPNS